ncbi:hypothetical protein [Inovirus D_HF34_8]|nr:hypothetical protein [Inovirus D_HF34_8]
MQNNEIPICLKRYRNFCLHANLSSYILPLIQGVCFKSSNL